MDFTSYAPHPQPDAPRGGSVGRLFSIATALCESSRPLTSSEVAHRSGVDTSTTHRLLQKLVEEGYAIRDSDKRFVGSPRLLFPLSPYHPWSMVRRDSAPALQSLRDRTGFSGVLIIFMSGQRILLEFVPGSDPMSPNFSSWVKTPLHASGSGKVLLSALSARDRARCLGPGPYASLTPHTITDPKELEADLQKCVQRGYAISVDEQIMGLRTIAAPVFTPSRRVFGCCLIYGRSNLLTDAKLQKCAEVVRETANFFSVSSPSARVIEDLVGDLSLASNEHSIDVLGSAQWVSRIARTP